MAQLNNIHDLEAYKNRIKEKSGLYIPLHSGGGNGNGGGMEARVAKLEACVEHIENDIAEIKIDIRDTRKDVQKIEVTLAKIKGESVLIRWMLGLVVAGIISLIIKSFFGG